MEQKERVKKERNTKGRPYFAPIVVSLSMKEAIKEVCARTGIPEATLVREAVAMLVKNYGIEVKEIHPLHGGVAPAGTYFSGSVLRLIDTGSIPEITR